MLCEAKAMKELLSGKKTNLIGYGIALQAILGCLLPLLQGNADIGATLSALYAQADVILGGFGLVALRAGVAKSK